MPTKCNRYYNRSRISEKVLRRIIHAFAMDFTATDAAVLTGISLRSVSSIYLKLRRRIAQHCEAQNPFQGEIEIDESYFGPRRGRGKRGRGAGHKTIVFGVFKRGIVFTPRSCPMQRKTLCAKRFGAASIWTASSILMAGPATMGSLTSATPSACASSTDAMNSPTTARTSTASRASGATPKDA